MTVPMQGQYSALDEQVNSAVFTANFYVSESSTFAINLMGQKKIVFIIFIFPIDEPCVLCKMFRTNVSYFQ